MPIKYFDIDELSSEKNNNPLFNFSSDFINKIQNISSTELGRSVPFILLKSLDDLGNILHDFSLDFFSSPFNVQGFKEGKRYSDRPTMSLKEIRAKTTFASGYLYYTDVTLEIKVHKPDDIVNNTLVPLLFPGAPLELEFGWNSPNEFLNKKSILKFALRSYNITIGADGQTDLTIEGTAFNERFNNTYVGDEGKDIDKILSGELKGEESKKALLKDNLSANFETFQKYVDYLNKLKDQKDKSGKHDYSLIESSLESYQTSRDKIRGEIRKNFRGNFDALSGLVENTSKRTFPKGHLKLHDIIDMLCTQTFNAMEKGLFFESDATYRFIYGKFHKDTGSGLLYGDTPISDFLIDYETLTGLFSAKALKEGEPIFTVEAFFNMLCSNFLENYEYWKKIDPPDNPEISRPKKSGVETGVKVPDVALIVNNYKVKDKRFIDIGFIDTSYGIPITSSVFKGKKSMSQNEFEKAVLSGNSLPVIRMGHSNSFIKQLSMTNIMDQYIKAALIVKMAEHSKFSTRSFIPPGFENADDSDTNTPLQLPLQGTMTVLGHVDWKPFRAFLLLTGVYIMDGIYKITSVDHVLNPEGYFTEVQFLYH